MSTAPTVGAPRFSHGVMTIELNGEFLDLMANVYAARTICRLYGGLQDAQIKVNGYDFDTLVTIINAASRRTGKAAEATAEDVFAAGIVVVGPLLSLYLNFLATGGKAPKTEMAPEPQPEDSAGGEAG